MTVDTRTDKPAPISRNSTPVGMQRNRIRDGTRTVLAVQDTPRPAKG